MNMKERATLDERMLRFLAGELSRKEQVLLAREIRKEKQLHRFRMFILTHAALAGNPALEATRTPLAPVRRNRPISRRYRLKQHKNTLPFWITAVSGVAAALLLVFHLALTIQPHPTVPEVSTDKPEALASLEEFQEPDQGEPKEEEEKKNVRIPVPLQKTEPAPAPRIAPITRPRPETPQKGVDGDGDPLPLPRTPSPAEPRGEAPAAIPDRPSPKPPATRASTTRIIALQGSASILSSSGTRRKAEENDWIRSGETLAMDDSALADLQWAGDTPLQVFPGTRLGLDETGTILRLEKGRIEGRSSSRSPRLETPLASFSSSNALFTLSADETFNRLEVREGSCDASLADGPSNIRVNQGQLLSFKAGNRNPLLRPLPPHALLRFRKGSRVALPGIPDALSRSIGFLHECDPGGNNGLLKNSGHRFNLDALILHTRLLMGFPPEDPLFQRRLATILRRDPARIYDTATTILLLEALDPVAYQTKIVECVQFIVDNQLEDGLWSYGEHRPIDPHARNYLAPSIHNRSRGASTVRVHRNGWGSGESDHANSSYAVLGLEAAMRTGVLPPRKTLLQALQGFVKVQNTDGGWGYALSMDQLSSGSMTASALASLVVCHRHLGTSWKTRAVKKGLRWLAENGDLTRNPGPEKEAHWHYFYLHGLTRLDALTPGLDLIPEKKLPALLDTLISRQSSRGEWKGKFEFPDTCFVLWFLLDPFPEPAGKPPVPNH